MDWSVAVFFALVVPTSVGMFLEARRLRMSNPLQYLLGGLLLWFLVAPMFLVHRHRRLHPPPANPPGAPGSPQQAGPVAHPPQPSGAMTGSQIASTLLGLLVMCAMGVCFLVNQPQNNAAPGNTGFVAPTRPVRMQTELVGVAVFSTQARGVQVCSRRDLHGCRVSFAEDQGFGTTTVDWPESDVNALVSCDDLGRRAYDSCPIDAGGHTTILGPDIARAPCLRQHGLFTRIGPSIRDPRDPQLEPGQVVVDCMEGYKRGRFRE